MPGGLETGEIAGGDYGGESVQHADSGDGDKKVVGVFDPGVGFDRRADGRLYRLDLGVEGGGDLFHAVEGRFVGDRLELVHVCRAGAYRQLTLVAQLTQLFDRLRLRQ